MLVVLRSRVEVNIQPLIDFGTFLEDFSNVTQQLAQEAYDSIRPSLLDELQTYAQQNVSRPFVWSNDAVANARARRWYFAAIGRGEIDTDSTRYIRSGRLRDSWQVELVVAPDQYTLLIKNAYRGTRYVVGTFSETAQWQIPGHAATGWQLVKPTVDFWKEAFVDEFKRLFNRYIVGEFGAFTVRFGNK